MRTQRPLSGCYKRKFSSERSARRAMKRARRIGVVAYYVCPFCGEYHLTSKRKRPTRVKNGKN